MLKPRRKPTLIVVAGPTGSGKTDLSITLAGHFGAPIISADSRQIYRGMAIGTAQPSARQLAAAKHYFIADHDIEENYNAGKYERDALALLDRLFGLTDVVIMAGGSGMYIDAVCDGMDSLPDADPEIRESLASRLKTEGMAPLLEELQRLDPLYYDRVDRNNPSRVVRALEVCIQTGLPYSSFRSGQKTERSFSVIKIGTLMPREVLYDRINRRVDIMIGEGLEQEARRLYPHKELNSLQTVGYRELFDHFDGTITREQAIELIKRNSRRYAKRQMTWLRKKNDVAWFDPAATDEIIRFIETELSRIGGD